MKNIIIFLIILIVIVALIAVIYYLKYKKHLDQVIEDYMYEKHFCNRCKAAFVMTRSDRKKTHCDFCGQPLTLHCKDPEFIAEQEQFSQTENTPFEDFNEKE